MADEDFENDTEDSVERGAVDVGESSDDGDSDPASPIKFSFKTLWLYTGPGFLMSVAYLDPGNIEADLQAGSTTGYTLLWVLFWATVMGLVLQAMAAKLGCCSGKHLAEHCADEFPWVTRIVLWFMAEVAIICVDCQEVIGTAIALNILSNGAIKLWVGVLLTALYTLTFLFMDRCIRKLELAFGILITIMSITFGTAYFTNLPDQGDVILGTVLPRVPSKDMPMAVGLIGAVIMPHNLYLHSALVLSRNVDTSKTKQVREAVFYNRIESSAALMVSFVINLFVVCVFANCRTDDEAANEKIGLWSAGDSCMDDVHGNGRAFKYIFAIGLLASGQAATVTSTYAGQYVMQGYLNLKVTAWKRAMLSRLIAIGPGLILGLVAPERADKMQEGLNIVQSVQLPFAIIPLLYFSANPASVGKDFVNGAAMRWVGWGITFIVVLANVYLIAGMVQRFVSDNHGDLLPLVITCVVIAVALYVLLVGWLFLGAIGVIGFKKDRDPRETVPLVSGDEGDDDKEEHDGTVADFTSSVELQELTNILENGILG
eukprot:gene4148-6445_t